MQSKAHVYNEKDGVSKAWKGSLCKSRIRKLHILSKSSNGVNNQEEIIVGKNKPAAKASIPAGKPREPKGIIIRLAGKKSKGKTRK